MTKPTLLLILILIYVFILSVFVEPNSLQVNKYEIQNQYLQGIRIVFLTDFHLKKHDYKKLDRIIELTNMQEPDLVLLGGDFANTHNYSSTMKAEIVAQKLGLLNAPIYGVLGDYDWWANGEAYIKAFNSSGIKILNNENVKLIIKRRYLDIAGIEDLETKRPDIESALKGTLPPRIVLTHNPDVYYDIMEDATLILAGHTHGGQFVLPFTPPMFVDSKYGAEFASGLIKIKHNQMIISRGIGTTFLPVRLNCKPEIVIIDFVAHTPQTNNKNTSKTKKAKK